MPETKEPVSSREVTIVREYDVPARYLFLAWSRPEHVRKWFGPAGWPITLCEIDFRVGGRFRFAMTGPSGVQNTPFGGTYLEIVPDRKIVFDNGFEGSDETMVMTITLNERDGRTTLTHHTVFSSASMYETHVGQGFVEGTNSGLDQLETVAGDIRRAG